MLACWVTSCVLVIASLLLLMEFVGLCTETVAQIARVFGHLATTLPSCNASRYVDSNEDRKTWERLDPNIWTAFCGRFAWIGGFQPGYNFDPSMKICVVRNGATTIQRVIAG